MVYRAIIQKLFSNQPKKYFDEVFRKVKILSANDGKCEAEMKVESEHSNTNGVLHNGFIATIVDLIPSCAVITHSVFSDQITTLQFFGPTIELNISYLQDIKVGEDIVIRAETLKVDEKIAYLTCIIINKKTDDICVTGSHVKYIADLINNKTKTIERQQNDVPE